MKIKQYIPWGLAFCAALVLSLPLLRPVSGGTLENPYRAPAFTDTDEREWLNSEPLT